LSVKQNVEELLKIENKNLFASVNTTRRRCVLQEAVTFSIGHSYVLCHANNVKEPVDVEVWIREGGVPLRMAVEGYKNIVESQCKITIYAPNTLFSQ
jgi:hypothetical protein